MAAALHEALTCVVPTYNRPDRLLRLLRYYRAAGCRAQLLILDSSDPDASRRAEVEALSGACGAVVRRYEPAMEPLRKMLEGLEKVSTPFVVFWADDDLMVPGALEEGVRWLEAHPEYSVVHGRSGLFAVRAGQVQWVAPYLQRPVVQETASARLRDHLQRYSVMFYSLHRTRALRENLRRVCDSGLDWHTWGEIALSALAVLQGKAHCLARLYMLREGHEGMWSAKIDRERAVDSFDWLTDSAFASKHGSFGQFRDCLAPELMRQDGISLPQAHEVVKQAFWPYLAGQMAGKWRPVPAARTSLLPGRLQAAARQVPGLRRTWRMLQRLAPGQRDAMSLPGLLRPWSLYHHDFVPIHRVVTSRSA